MNHRVHVCMSGCFTLKLSGSWNTVRISPSEVAAVEACSLDSPEASSDGEMGIVLRSTCWSGCGAVATSAMVKDGIVEVGAGCDACRKQAAVNGASVQLYDACVCG